MEMATTMLLPLEAQELPYFGCFPSRILDHQSWQDAQIASSQLIFQATTALKQANTTPFLSQFIMLLYVYCW
jgi:hypothetical protein